MSSAAPQSRTSPVRRPATAERGRPLLLIFCSRHDGRSRRVLGYIAQVLQRRKNHDTFDLRHVDVEERPDLTEHFRVTDIPTLLVVADKRVQRRLVKPSGCGDIEQALMAWLH
jgi:KaiB domain